MIFQRKNKGRKANPRPTTSRSSVTQMSCKVLHRVVFKIVLGEGEPQKTPRKEISIKAIYTYLKASVLVLRCNYVQ